MRLTLSEQRLVDQLDSAHQEVFGTFYMEGFTSERIPNGRVCPRCHDWPWTNATHNQLTHEQKFAQYRRELRALKILVSRVRKGETFELKGGEHFNNITLAAQRMVLADRRLHTYETEFEHLAKSPRPKKEEQRKKQSRSKPSLSEELAELARLRETGALTELEFKVAKHKLLDAPSPKKRKRQAARKKGDEGPPDLPE